MAERQKETHPVRGGIWGVVFGLGLALLAVNLGVVGLSVAPLIAIVVLGVVLGLAWSLFGPAKSPRGADAADAGV